MACTDLRASSRHCLRTIGTLVVAQLLFACSATAQIVPASGRFVAGPLTWTPTLALREAGVDSNVFNTSTDPKEDITGTFSPSVDSLLTLGVTQLATQGQVEFLYFERYTNQRAINGRVAARMQFPTTRIQPIVTGNWARTKERSGNELDVRVPRTELGYTTGLGMTVTPGSSLDATIGRTEMRYDAGVLFRGVDVAARLNRRSTEADLTFRAGVTPFTKLFVSAGAARDEFINDVSRSTDNLRGAAGFEFASDAVIRGRATVGYHSMEPRGSDKTLAFQGWTTAVDLSYALLGRTLLAGRLSRDTSYSVLDGRPYYLSTAGSLAITHNVFGPVDLDLRGIREKLDYTATPAGLPARTDYVDALGAGVTIRASSQTRIGFYYDTQIRYSSEGTLPGYRRQHAFTSIIYGF